MCIDTVEFNPRRLLHSNFYVGCKCTFTYVCTQRLTLTLPWKCYTGKLQWNYIPKSQGWKQWLLHFFLPIALYVYACSCREFSDFNQILCISVYMQKRGDVDHIEWLLDKSCYIVSSFSWWKRHMAIAHVRYLTHRERENANNRESLGSLITWGRCWVDTWMRDLTTRM